MKIDPSAKLWIPQHKRLERFETQDVLVRTWNCLCEQRWEPGKVIPAFVSRADPLSVLHGVPVDSIKNIKNAGKHTVRDLIRAMEATPLSPGDFLLAEYIEYVTKDREVSPDTLEFLRQKQKWYLTDLFYQLIDSNGKTCYFCSVDGVSQARITSDGIHHMGAD